MVTEIIMPKLGMTMKEGTIVEWLKKENEPVKKGEAIAEISSEKIENEIEAPEDGILLKILFQENAVVPVASPIGYIGQEGDQIESINKGRADHMTKKQEQVLRIEQQTPPLLIENRKRMIASPSARKIAQSLGVDLERVVGTGPNGRITRGDVEKAAGKKVEASPSSVKETEQVFSPASDEMITPVTMDKTANIKLVEGIRKVIADRMYQSLQQTAQLTLMIKADVTDLLHLQKAIRDQLDDNSNSKLTVTDFIAKATIMALSRHKLMNSTFEDEKIHMYDEVHLGIAVALDEGLVVPVIRNGEKLSLKEISSQIRDLSQRGRLGKLDRSEIEGPTFTITNLGRSGVEYFTPVLNTPNSGTLGIGTIQVTPVFSEDGSVLRRDLLPLSLTFDHRALDGVPASEFLATVKKYLENPYSLLL